MSQGLSKVPSSLMGKTTQFAEGMAGVISHFPSIFEAWQGEGFAVWIEHNKNCLSGEKLTIDGFEPYDGDVWSSWSDPSCGLME